MTGEEPVSEHVFTVERDSELDEVAREVEGAAFTPETRAVLLGLLRRWRWRCSCGASEGGFWMKTSAIYAGDNHAMSA